MKQQTAHVQVYSVEWCPFCIDARALLDQVGIEYELTDLTDHPDRRNVTAKILAGHRTAPLIVIDDEPIGGFTELAALHAAGELATRVFCA
ncbi:MAG: glutaredoxin [Planctomycetes bacterium]|jgi:glutaredoxin 3|nr:glutaredoxin [Planctomycetota bacterium]